MTHIHEQDQPFRPDIKETERNDDSDATFALDAADPARVDNRNGLNNTEIEPDTSGARSEYSSDPSFAENGMDDEADDDEVIEEIIGQDDNEAESSDLEEDADLQDQLEAEMDEEDEEIEAELDDEPQRSEGSID